MKKLILPISLIFVFASVFATDKLASVDPTNPRNIKITGTTYDASTGITTFPSNVVVNGSITGAGSTGFTSTNMYQTSISGDSTYKTAFSYTTTKGSGALLRIHAQGGSDNGYFVNFRCNLGGTLYYGAASGRGSAGQNGMANFNQDFLLSSNITVVVEVQSDGGNVIPNFIYGGGAAWSSNSFRAFFTEMK